METKKGIVKDAAFGQLHTLKAILVYDTDAGHLALLISHR